MNESFKDAPTSVHVGDFITYDWEKAYLFTPYTEEEDMQTVLGPSFQDPVNMSLRDDIMLLVVVKENNTFEYAGIKLGNGYPSMEEAYLTPENDVLGISEP
ncbi:hypothetical protein SFC66_13290 [Terribacillus saccharophilus]|uniref:hypothetical protein n=1 Tax=Terribacillus saccharophilus TaxID=361277 RepID=UPI003981F709